MTTSLREHAIYGGNALCYITTLVSLVTISIVMVEKYKVLICHVTSREYTLKGLCEFMGGSPSR